MGNFRIHLITYFSDLRDQDFALSLAQCMKLVLLYSVQFYNVFGKKIILIAVNLSWIVVESHMNFDENEG